MSDTDGNWYTVEEPVPRLRSSKSPIHALHELHVEEHDGAFVDQRARSTASTTNNSPRRRSASVVNGSSIVNSISVR